MTDVIAADRDASLPRSEEQVERPPSRRRTSVGVTVIILVLMGFSAVAHVSALHRELPLQDTDEAAFVRPAVDIAATGDLNPHWFGHPGSTVIYPVAVLIHTWDAGWHGGPVLGSHGELKDRFVRDPTPFYVIGRLWVIALSVASIPMIYLLGARAFNRRVALIGAALWTVLPYPIHHARIVRTESAAVFFGVVALYFCVRAWQEPRRRRWVVAGLSVGVAVSSRYFMIALAPALLGAVALPLRRDVRRAAVAAAIAVSSMIAGFVLTTPFFLFDLHTARRNLNAEATVPHTVATGFSRPGNARWYLADAIPHSMTWPLYVLALVGLAIVLWRRVGRQLLLAAFCVVFLIGISASALHWQRWDIELIPVLVLLAALTIYEVSMRLSAWLPASMAPAFVIPVVAAAVLAIGPLVDLVDTNRHDRDIGSRLEAREWLQGNAPPGSRVVQDSQLFNLPPRSIAPIGHDIRIDYSLDTTKTVDQYRAVGYDYIVTFAGDPFHYFTQEKRYPKQAQFFRGLACETRLVAYFRELDRTKGPPITVYRLDQRPRKLLDIFCQQPVPNA
jgi:4-amino-4-deoxy-L-arabinose transferase-like glycosyltransferase